MKKIRVAYLMHGVYYGGATRSLQLMLESLQGKAVELYIFTTSCRSQSIKNELRRLVDGFEIIDLATISNNQYAHESYEDAMSKLNTSVEPLLARLKANGIDILHINSTVFPHILRRVKKEIPCIKVITHIRELIPKYGDGRLQRYVTNEISVYSDQIICISNNEQEPFVSSNKSIILPNPFDFDKINNIIPTLRSDYNIGENTILVGMLSHFSAAKGHMLFLEALKLISEKYLREEYKFVIIGVKNSPHWKLFLKKLFLRNDYELKVIKFIKQNRIKDNLILIPYTNKPLSYIADIDLLVRPALTADPWGRDIIEAMALSKPVIATGESTFYVKNDFTGYLIPPNNSTSMAEKILYLIYNPNIRTKFGQNASELIKKMCDIDNYGLKIFSIYEKI